MSGSGTRISPWNSLVDGRLTFDLTTQDLVLDQLTKENARLRKELAEGGGGTKEEIEALEKEIQDLRNRNNSLIVQLTLSEQSNQTLTTENKDLSEANEKLEKDNEILRSFISDGGKTVIELYNTALQEIEQLNNNVKQLQETIDQLNADINSWKSLTGYDDLYGIQTAKNSIKSVTGDTPATDDLNSYITSIVEWGTGINSAYSSSLDNKASGTKITDVVNAVLGTIGDSTSNATLDILNERVQAYVDNQANYKAELDAVYSIIGPLNGNGPADVQGLLDSYKDNLKTYTGTISEYTTFVGFENDYIKALQAYSQLISYAKAAITILDGTGTDADATDIQTKASLVLQSFQTSLSPWSITSTNIYDLIVPIVNELNKGSSSETTVTALQNTIVGYYQITHDSTANSYDSSMDKKINDLLTQVRRDIRDLFVGMYNNSELPSKVDVDDVINYYFETSSGESGELSSVFLRTIVKCQNKYKDDLDAAEQSLLKEKNDHQADLNTIYKQCSGDDKDNASLSEITKSISDLVTNVGKEIDTANKQDGLWKDTTVPPTTNLVDCGTAVTLMRTNYHNKVDTYDSSESSLQDIVDKSIGIVGATDKDHLVSTLEQIRKDLYGLYNGSTEGFTSINAVTTSMSTSIENIKDLIGGNTAKNLESIIENLTNLLGKDEGDLDKPSVNKTLGKLSGLYDSSTHTSFEPLLTNMSTTISNMNTTIGSGGLSRIDEIKNSLDGVLNSLNTLAQLPEEEVKTNITAAVTAVDSRLTTLGNELTKANTRADTAEKSEANTKTQYNELVAVTGNYAVVKSCLTTLYSLYDKSIGVTWPTTENPTPSYTLSDIKSKFNIELPKLWKLTNNTKTYATKQDLVTLNSELTTLVGGDNSLDDLLDNIGTFYDTSSLKAPTLTNAITAISIYCNQINDLCKLSSSIDTSYIDTSYKNLSNVKTNLGTMLTLDEQTTYSTIPDRVTYITGNVGGAVSTILASIKEKTGDETSTTINAAVTNIESTGKYRIYLQEIAGMPTVTDIGSLIGTIHTEVIEIVKAVTGETEGYPEGMNIEELAANVTSAASKLESVTGVNYIYKGETDGSAYEINWAFDATNEEGIRTYYADCNTISNLTDKLSNTRAYLQAIHGNTLSTLINTLINEINTIIGNIADDSLKKLLDDLNEKITGHESTLSGAVNQVGSGQTDDDRKRLNMLIDGTDDSCATMDAAIKEADRLIGEIKDKVYADDKTLTSINDAAGSTGITGTQIATIYSYLISGNMWQITYDGKIREIKNTNRDTKILIEDIGAIANYIANIVRPNMNGNFQTIYDEINNKLRAQTDEGLAKMMGCESLKEDVAVENSTLNTLTQCVTEIIGESDLGSLRQKLYKAATEHPTDDGHKYTTMTELISSIYGTYIENAILAYLNNLSGDTAGSILDAVKNIYGHAKNINRLVYGQNESSEELTIGKSMKDVVTDLSNYINNIFANGGWTDNHDVAMIDTNIKSLHDALSNAVYGNTDHTIKDSMTQINAIGVSSLNDNLAKLQALYGSTAADAAKYSYYKDNDVTYTLTWPTSTTNGSSDDPEEPDVPEAVSDLTKVVNQIVEDVKLINSALTSDNKTKLSTAAANILTYRDALAYLLESDSTSTDPPYPFSTKTISGSAGQLRDDTSAIWTTIGAVEGYKACLDDAARYLPDLRNSMATIVDGSDGSTLVSILEVLSGIEGTLKDLAGKDNIYDDVGVISGEWNTLKVIIGDVSLSSTLQSSLNAMIEQIDGTTEDTTVSTVKDALDTAWGKYKGLVEGPGDGYLYKPEPSDETKNFYLLIQTKMTDESVAVNTLKGLIGGGSEWNPTTIDGLKIQLIAEVNGLSDCIVGDHLYEDDGSSRSGHNGYASVYAAWKGLESIVGVELSDNLTKERSKLTGILINATGTTSMSELITKCQNDVNTIYKLYDQDDPGDKTMSDIDKKLGAFIANMSDIININPAITIKDIDTCYTQLTSDLSMIYTGQTSNPASTSVIKNMLDEITTAITSTTDSSYAYELARYQTLVGTE